MIDFRDGRGSSVVAARVGLKFGLGQLVSGVRFFILPTICISRICLDVYLAFISSENSIQKHFVIVGSVT
jgi:hypothetical protein